VSQRIGVICGLWYKPSGLKLNPLVDVLIVADGMRHEEALHLADFIQQRVVLLLESQMLRPKGSLCLFKAMHPFLFLLTTFGCGYAISPTEFS
jgi:hypothetical protein